MSESPYPATPLDDIEPAVAECVSEVLAPGGCDSVVSVWLGDLDGGVHVALDAAVPHYAASTMKLPLVATAFRLHEEKALDLDLEVAVHNEFRSAADGSTYAMHRSEDQDEDTWERIGSTCTLRRLAEQATVRSGNLATNLLLEQVGVPAVAAGLAALGCSVATTVGRGIEDAAARAAGLDNRVTAADLGVLLRAIGSRSLADAATCGEIEGVLSRQEHRDGVPAGLPAGTYVASKSGWVQGVTHDAALVRPDRTPAYVLVVLTTLDVPEETANALIAHISAVVWEGWQR